MLKPPVPLYDSQRIQALVSMNVLDTPPEERFDRVTRLAAAFFGAPIALVSLVDEKRQWFKSAVGLGVCETARDISFCGHAILSESAMVVENALDDARFRDNPLVTGPPEIRFYAGQPLRAPTGEVVGTLCIIDRVPRLFDTQQRAALADFAHMVEGELHRVALGTALAEQRAIKQQFAAILNTALDCIISIDEHGHVLEFNPAAERTFGYRREDALGKLLGDLIVPPKYRDAHRAGMARYLQTGEQKVLGRRIEITAMRADGTEFPVELAITRTQDAGRRTFSAYLRDITEAERLKSLLSLQHSASRTIAQSALRDDDTPERILHAICASLGWQMGALWTSAPQSSALACTWMWADDTDAYADFIDATRAARFERGRGLIGQIWESGEPLWVENLGENDSFTRGPAAARSGFRAGVGIPVRAKGKFVGVMEFFSRSIREPDRNLMNMLEAIGNQIGELLERKRGERRLQRLTAELDAIFNLSPDGFLAFDSHGTKSYANARLMAMFGLQRHDIESFAEDDFDRLLSSCAEELPHPSLLRSSRDGDSWVLKISRPKPAVLKLAVKMLRSPEGQTSGKVVYFRDITNDFEVNRMKSEFLSVAAHELRTPMASILGFSELLINRTYDAETRKDLLQTIHRQASHLTRLINELLDLARIEARASKDFNIVAQPLWPLVTRTVENLLVPDDPRKVRITLPKQSPVVLADTDKFSQALLNVLSNAYKYSPAGGAIELGSTKRDVGGVAQIGISVQDHGLGMTAEQSARVLERFYRAHPTHGIPGSGLGLSLVQEIMSAHGGEVEIQSTPGQGTRVTLWLRQA